jgi:hypothetical protein
MKQPASALTLTGTREGDVLLSTPFTTRPVFFLSVVFEEGAVSNRHASPHRIVGFNAALRAARTIAADTGGRILHHRLSTGELTQISG